LLDPDHIPGSRGPKVMRSPKPSPLPPLSLGAMSSCLYQLDISIRHLRLGSLFWVPNYNEKPGNERLSAMSLGCRLLLIVHLTGKRKTMGQADVLGCWLLLRERLLICTYQVRPHCFRPELRNEWICVNYACFYSCFCIYLCRANVWASRSILFARVVAQLRSDAVTEKWPVCCVLTPEK